MPAVTNEPDEAGTIAATRIFDAPRELVFDVWCDPKHISNWWRPRGFTTTTRKMDVRPGGEWLFVMHGPDGTDYPNEIFISSFSDSEGGLTRHPGAPEWPLQLISTILFEERDNGTLVTVRWSPYEATELERATFDAGHDSMRGGWSGTFDQLAGYLAGKG